MIVRSALIALVVAALAGAAEAAPPRRVTAEIPDLARSTPALLELLRWAALAEQELAPDRLGARIASAVGVDPFSPKALRDAGVNASKPVRIRLEGATRQLVIEVALADATKAKAHAEALRASLGAEAVAGASGFVLGDEPSEAIALVVRDDAAIAVIGAGYKSGRLVRTSSAARRAAKPVDAARDRRLAVLAPPKKGRAEVRPGKALLDGAPADLWAVIEPDEGVERVDLVVRLKPGEAAIQGEVALDLGAEVVLAEGLRGRASSTRLVDPGVAAIDLAVTLSRAGLREALGRVGLPPALAPLLAGPVQLGIADDGTAYGAATLDAKVDAAAVTKALGAGAPGVKVAVVDRLLIASTGERAIKPASGGAARGALAVDVLPAPFLSVLDRHRTRLGIRPMALMMAKMILARLVQATELVTVDASMPSNRLQVSARLKYRAPPP